MAILGSCEKEYIEPNQFSDVSWYSTQFRNTAGHLFSTNQYASFVDLSRGAVNHKWELLDEGCYYLNGPITSNDSVYDNFIAGDSKTSEDKTIHVLFKTPGIKRVRLYNEFTEPVVFNGWDTVHAVQVGDKWVIDTSFVVDVYDTIVPKYKVFDPSGNEITLVEDADSSKWVTIEIEAGQSLTYVDMSTQGRPNDRTWLCDGGTPGSSADSAASIIYTRLGVFTTIMDSKRTGQNIPYGYARVQIPLKVKVLKSSLPFEILGDGAEQEDETIQLSFNGEFQPFTDQAQYFTVNVRNTAAGLDKDVEIQTLEINKSVGSILDLKLAEPIYSSDIITISYAGGGLLSVDDRELEEFTSIGVDMHKVNLLHEDVYSFETEHAKWVARDDTYTGIFEFTTENAYDGSYSLKLTATAGSNVGVNNPETTDGLYKMEKGASYTFSYWYYIEAPGTNIVEYTTYLMPLEDWEETKVWTNGGSKDRWVQKTVQFDNFGGVSTDRYFFMRLLHNADATDDVPSIYYIDKLELSKAEERP